MVVAIIGVLASLVLVALGSSKKKSRDMKRINDLKQVGAALELYHDSNPSIGYPGTNGSNQWTAMSSALNSSGYISSVPKDPLTGTYDYEYWVASDNESYVLNATLEIASASALDNDIDGVVLGCFCIDPEYCFKY